LNFIIWIWRKKELNWGCLSIIVNCCVDYDYMMLNDHFRSNNGALEVQLIKHQLGFYNYAWFMWVFILNMLIWIKLSELWCWIDYWIKYECFVNFTKFSGLWKVSFMTMKKIGWINWVSKWTYRSILSVYLKRNIEYSVRLIMKSFWVF